MSDTMVSSPWPSLRESRSSCNIRSDTAADLLGALFEAGPKRSWARLGTLDGVVGRRQPRRLDAGSHGRKPVRRPLEALICIGSAGARMPSPEEALNVRRTFRQSTNTRLMEGATRMSHRAWVLTERDPERIVPCSKGGERRGER